MARLIPQDGKFFDLFKADADNLAAAAGQLAEMLEKYDKLDQRVNSIEALEKKGDHLTDQIGDRLADAFVTPFDREDIYEMAARLDDVVDYIQAVAETVVIYGVEQPTPESRRLSQILAEQGDELAKAMSGLQARKDVEAHLERVHDLEHEADGLSRAAVAATVQGAPGPARSDQVARPVQRPRERQRRRRGCRRSGRAYAPQGDLFRRPSPKTQFPASTATRRFPLRSRTQHRNDCRCACGAATSITSPAIAPLTALAQWSPSP